MRSYPRSGVQIERCDQCRGIFLDEGELETLTRNEAQYGPGGMPPPGYGGYAGGGYPGGYQDPNNQGGYAGPQYPGYGPYGGGAWQSGDPNNPAPPPDR
jgi:Zn-finger nucleic acid-binding protein